MPCVNSKMVQISDTWDNDSLSDVESPAFSVFYWRESFRSFLLERLLERLFHWERVLNWDPGFWNPHFRRWNRDDTEKAIEIYRKVAQALEDDLHRITASVRYLEQHQQVAKLERKTPRKRKDCMSTNTLLHPPKLLNVKPNKQLRGMHQMKQPCQRRNFMKSRSQRHSKSK